jgi:hypothetical protein
VSNCFDIGRALGGFLPGLLPVGKSLPHESRLGVVMREEFGLGLFDVSNFLLQHLSDLLVISLTGALEQRLIGRVLNERVLEEIPGLRG